MFDNHAPRAFARGMTFQRPKTTMLAEPRRVRIARFDRIEDLIGVTKAPAPAAAQPPAGRSTPSTLQPIPLGLPGEV